MRTNKLFLAAVCAAALAPSLFANVKPATIFGSNMVLQRDIALPVWGTADPGEEVEVTFAGQTAKAVADKAGKWEVKFSPLAIQKEGSDMVLKGKDTVTLKNILVGDVWLCSGQSNMEMSFGWGIMDGSKFIADADNYPLIRRVKVQHVVADYPLENVPCSTWTVCSKDTVKDYTACGYFFTRKLLQETGIPMGILDDNWSGCRIEPFMAPEGFAGPEFAQTAAQLKPFTVGAPEWKAQSRINIDKMKAWVEKAEANLAEDAALPYMPFMPTLGHGPTAQYNAMIAPIVRFPIKGAIWYQGCSNGNEGETYYQKMVGLVEGWRKVWKIDFPFYFVQLAAFTAKTEDPRGGNGYANIREAQRKSMSIPKTGMACTIDIGNQSDIHPKNKIDVGERLARWALRDEYGKKDLVVSGPLFKSMKIENGKAILSFDYADGLMTAQKNGYAMPVRTPNVEPKHFAIAGADKQWQWADAAIENGKIVLSSPLVPEPVAVRYAFRAYPDGVNVYNADGLPMVPFRTDDWDLTKK